MASTASSILSFTRRELQKMYVQPPMMPMMKAAQGATTEHPAVMLTRPPRAPFMHMVMSYMVSPVFLRVKIMSVKMAVTADVAAVIVVVTAHRAATLPEAAEAMARVLPGLKPYHPTQRTNVPRT